MKAREPRESRKAGKLLTGCLLVCVAVALLGLLLAAIGYGQRGRLLEWGLDRLGGGPIAIDEPASFRRLPVPLAVRLEGVRSSCYVGDLSPAEARAAFAAALTAKGWRALAERDAPEGAFALFLQGEEGEAGLTADYFERGGDVLLLFVTGREEGTVAGLVAAPHAAAAAAHAAFTPRAPLSEDVPGRDIPGIKRFPGSIRTASEFMEHGQIAIHRNSYVTYAEAREILRHYQHLYERAGAEFNTALINDESMIMGSLIDKEDRTVRFHVIIRDCPTYDDAREMTVHHQVFEP